MNIPFVLLFVSTSVYAKVSYLFAGILNDKSDFSPVTEIFEK